MRWYEAAFGAHYPFLYAHRDGAEAARAVAALRRLAPLGGGTVLDLGCGAGRHLPALAAEGAAVVGLDLSGPLLAKARTGGQSGGARIWLLRGDMRQLPLRRGACTAVVSLFTAFGYFGPLAAHDGVVAEIAGALGPGGHWFLDYLNCGAVRRELSAEAGVSRRRLAPPLEVVEERRLAPDRVIKTVLLRPVPSREGEAAALGVPADGLRYAEEVALFTPDELDEMAGRHGLRRVAQAGGYASEPADDPGAPRWIAVYRREARNGGSEA